MRRVVCANPAYLAARGVPATPDDLARHSVVSLEGVSVPTSWSFGSGEAETRVSFRARLSVNTIDAAVAAGLSGAGLVRTLSYQVADYARDGRMSIVLDAFELRRPPCPSSTTRATSLPRKLRAFIDFVVPSLRGRLAEVARSRRPERSRRLGGQHQEF